MKKSVRQKVERALAHIESAIRNIPDANDAEVRVGIRALLKYASYELNSAISEGQGSRRTRRYTIAANGRPIEYVTVYSDRSAEVGRFVWHPDLSEWEQEPYPDDMQTRTQAHFILLRTKHLAPSAITMDYL